MSNVVLITGSRFWKNGRSIVRRLMEEPDGTTVINGGARGADSFADYAAKALGFKSITVEANWGAFGRSAGPMRNRQMLDMQPHKVIAFHEDLRHSLGTKDCVEQAMQRKIPVEVINE